VIRVVLSRIKLERFTAFESVDIELFPGINIFTGANATGKTHVMKVAYAACDVTKTRLNFTEKLTRVFLPSGWTLGRLVKRSPGSAKCTVEVFRDQTYLHASFSNRAQKVGSATVVNFSEWVKDPVETAFIPTKEVLSNAPGFRSLYAQREIHFEEVHFDILDRAYRPALRGPADSSCSRVLAELEKVVGGQVVASGEEFFLRSKRGDLEFSLLAEGLRKLGLLWLLVQNGTLRRGSVLFWDEPGASLNPSLFKVLVSTLLELHRAGVQILAATHDYAVLRELDSQRGSVDSVAFHSLYRDTVTGEVLHRASERLEVGRE